MGKSRLSHKYSQWYEVGPVFLGKKNAMRKTLLLFGIWALVLTFTKAQNQAKYQANWASIDARPVPAWFNDAKFGIFIHWGLFSVPAWAPTAKNGVGIYERYAEWYWQRQSRRDDKLGKIFNEYHDRVYGADFQYPDFVKDFKAELFEPQEWARVFEESGAKYVVLTSKHHEGFTLWPSAYAWNWNSLDVGPHRDLAGDLIKAVKARNLRMGYYYSLYEWFNPLYKSDVSRYVDQHMIPQMKELVTRYQPDVLWTDGEWDHPSETWRSTEFLAWLFNESPVKDVVAINDRWGKETRAKHGGYFTTEYDLVHDQNSSGMQFSRPWEECRGIGSSFGYNRNEYLEDYSTSEQLVHILIDKVARGGNLLLNIGPTADGRIPVIMQQRLHDMGVWLKTNGEAIYGTSAWAKAPANRPAQVAFTTKGNDLYVICTQFPTQALQIEGVKGGTVSMLGWTGELKSSFKSGKMTIQIPAVTPANNPCQYAWVFKIAGGI
jgi:alpha-L-fucosidase